MTAPLLSTMQRNALCQYFGRKYITAEDVAGLDYCTVIHLPKIGRKGIQVIRAWLQQQGYDLKNLPVQSDVRGDQRLNRRLQNAARLLEKHGYWVGPPPS